MANIGALVFLVSVLSLLCMVDNIICSISSKEARILITKLGMFENKLFTALVDIEDIRSSVGTCQCPSQNSTLTDASVAQLDTAETNGIEETESKAVQSCVERITNGLSDEKQAKKMFEKQMVNLIQDQMQSPIHGGWADWTPYGLCSQTCGIGLKRRHRECSNPHPSSGGNQCYGDYTDEKICMENECLHVVHGGWADWKPWGVCSQSCGIGLKRRHRECSNPHPSSGGNPCYGDYTDDKICMEKECAHIDWAPYGLCSQTCGIGLKRRHRECSNPYPLSGGYPCYGDYTDDKICIEQECPHVDGGWSRWTSWSLCTATCNGGLRTRGRRCNNPKPSSHGRYCTGYNMNSKLCNYKSCPEPIVFFNVGVPKSALVNNVVVFDNVADNSGNGNSSTTGKFTCKIPGLYYFSVRLISKSVSESGVMTYCGISKNNLDFNYVYNTASKNELKSASASLYANLETGDTVDVGGCSGFENVKQFSFHGAFITAS